MASFVWFLIALCLLLFETCFVPFTFIYFFAGAFVAFIASFWVATLMYQLFIFLLITLLSFGILYPIFSYTRKKLSSKEPDMIGSYVHVIKTVGPKDIPGRVQDSCSMDWKAFSCNGDEIKAGRHAKVVQQVGIKLFISKED